MIKKSLIAIFAIFTLFSCSLDDDNTNDDLSFKIETLPIKEAVVPTEFEFGTSYTIKVIYDLTSGCHSFYDLYYEHQGSSRIVAVNSIVSTNLACTDDIREEEHEFEVTALQQEDYTFRFWKGKDTDGSDIFEDIIVKVVMP